MDTRHWVVQTSLLIAGIFAVLLELAGCLPGQAPTLTQTTVLPTTSPTPFPTLSLDQTNAKEFLITDFKQVHSPFSAMPINI
jgi:hypothetical protein